MAAHRYLSNREPPDHSSEANRQKGLLSNRLITCEISVYWIRISRQTNFRLLIGILLVELIFSLPAFAHNPKRIYLANDDHTDYMWSANEETYRGFFIFTGRLIDPDYS